MLAIFAEAFHMHFNRFANELHRFVSRFTYDDAARQVRHVHAEGRIAFFDDDLVVHHPITLS